MRVTLRVFTIGHGRRPLDELLACLSEDRVETLVDVRRFPGSRRNPHFGQASLTAALDAAGIGYLHAVELGGFRSGAPGEERFACLGMFAGYAARMETAEWQAGLAEALAAPAPCLMCAETSWRRCHRRLISELLVSRGYQVVHLIRPHEREQHRLYAEAEIRDGRLYLCGEVVGPHRRPEIGEG